MADPIDQQADWRAEVHLVPMRRRHIRQAMRIEAQASPSPWSHALFATELSLRTDRHYVVARIEGVVTGFAGMMLIAGEAHVTNIAVDPAWHGRKIATALLANLVRHAGAAGCSDVTLEVRVSNSPARALYERFGFVEAGLRKNYYTESREDAVIMWATGVDTDEYRSRIDKIEKLIPYLVVDET